MNSFNKQAMSKDNGLNWMIQKNTNYLSNVKDNKNFHLIRGISLLKLSMFSKEGEHLTKVATVYLSKHQLSLRLLLPWIEKRRKASQEIGRSRAAFQGLLLSILLIYKAQDWWQRRNDKQGSYQLAFLDSPYLRVWWFPH